MASEDLSAGTGNGTAFSPRSFHHLRREFTRGLVLCAQRSYVETLQVIATAAQETTFLKLAEESGGGSLNGLLSLSLEDEPHSLSSPKLATTRPDSLAPEDCLPSWWLNQANNFPPISLLDLPTSQSPSHSSTLLTKSFPSSPLRSLYEDTASVSSSSLLHDSVTVSSQDRFETMTVGDSEVIHSSNTSPKKKGIFSSLGLGNLRNKKRVSIGSDPLPALAEKTSSPHVFSLFRRSRRRSPFLFTF
jgi:hypothetical protein